MNTSAVDVPRREVVITSSTLGPTPHCGSTRAIGVRNPCALSASDAGADRVEVHAATLAVRALEPEPPGVRCVQSSEMPGRMKLRPHVRADWPWTNPQLDPDS
jgi:hypothetical protein